LRSLGVLSGQNNVVVNPGSVLDLSFALNVPWGAKSIQASAGDLVPEVTADGHQLIWELKPGELNHLEVLFWVPSPIGIGAIVIILVAIAGNALKHQLLPKLGLDRQPRKQSSVNPH
jgi:Protein of unknown function (DUF3153)